VGFKGGFADVERKGTNTTGVYMGLDGNVKITEIEYPSPFDIYLAVGLSSILKSRRALNEFFIGPVGEKTLSSGDVLSIKGTLGLEAAVSGGSLADNDDFDAFITGGLIFNLGDGANFSLELKAGTDFVGGAGINFEF
jgi:hypothetical protein